jgi:nitrite reductase/ring-hydroxylating ferredoxin subunit
VPTPPELPHTCEVCELQARRAFLREAALALAGVAAALGASPARAAALSVRFVRALGRAGDELTYAIPAEDGAQIDHDNQVITVRYQGKAYAFNLACPHQNTALRWEQEDMQFQCPRHHSRYRPDGVFISGRATRGMDRFAVRKDGGSLIVNVAELYRQDKDGSQWEAAFVTL